MGGLPWTTADEYWELKAGVALRPDYWQTAPFTVEPVPHEPLWTVRVRQKAGDHRWRDAVDRRNIDALGSVGAKGKIFDHISSGSAYAIANYGQSSSDYEADHWPVIPSGFHPGAYDSDIDGMRDSWEQQHYSGPLSEELIPWEDMDGDGWTNLEEFLNMTDPTVGDDPCDLVVESHVEGSL